MTRSGGDTKENRISPNFGLFKEVGSLRVSVCIRLRLERSIECIQICDPKRRSAIRLEVAERYNLMDIETYPADAIQNSRHSDADRLRALKKSIYQASQRSIQSDFVHFCFFPNKKSTELGMPAIGFRP